jgi:hypothetical protein
MNTTIDDKAIKLVEKFEKAIDPNFGILKKRNVVVKAKQCALICVDEIISFISEDPYYNGFDFWPKVKEKIQSL